MNHTPALLRLAGLFALAAGLASTVDAQEPSPSPEKLLRIQVEWIALDSERLTSLLRERPESDTALRETMQGLIEDGDAELVDTSLVTAAAVNAPRWKRSRSRFIRPSTRLLDFSTRSRRRVPRPYSFCRMPKGSRPGTWERPSRWIRCSGRRPDHRPQSGTGARLPVRFRLVGQSRRRGRHRRDPLTPVFHRENHHPDRRDRGEYCLLSASRPATRKPAHRRQPKVTAFVRVDVIPVTAKPAPSCCLITKRHRRVV